MAFCRGKGDVFCCVSMLQMRAEERESVDDGQGRTGVCI